MNFLSGLLGLNQQRELSPLQEVICGAIPYGKTKSDGSHDHRGNRGRDRTPAQRAADAAKRK